MSQILHIFRKDVRHHWLEILGTLALLTAYAWHTMHLWGETEPPVSFWSVLWKGVMVLVPASWCLLMIRMIQDESLVGDRQFWITRPYDWRKLAAAKLLSAVAFVHVPLLIVQAIMLGRAGFPAIHYLKGLLWLQMLIFLAVVLTSAVLAVVTSNIVQVLLSIVGLALYAFGMAGLNTLFPDNDMPNSTAASNYWSYAIFAAIALALIVLQFGWRRTWISRMMIFGFGLLGALAVVVPSYNTLEKVYPPTGAREQPAVKLEVQARGPAGKKKNEISGTGKKVSLTFPVTGTDIAHGTIARLEGTTVTIQAPNGASWKSHWIGEWWTFYPGGGVSSVQTEVDRKFFEQNRDAQVNVRFEFAITGYRETDIREVTAEPGEFQVAGVGTCWVSGRYYWRQRWLGCRSPLRQPSFMGRMDSSASTCTPTATDDPDLHTSLYTWMANDDEDAADFGITPVKFFEFYFQEAYSRSATFARGEPKSPLNVCVGTPFTLAQPVIFQHARAEAELDGVKLSDYMSEERSFPF